MVTVRVSERPGKRSRGSTGPVDWAEPHIGRHALKGVPYTKFLEGTVFRPSPRT